MKRSRATYFVSDSPESTLSTVAHGLRPFAAYLADRGVGLYSSDQMNGAADDAGLARNASLLEAMVRVDPRGGFFSQTVLESALHHIFEVEQLRATLAVRCGAEMPPESHVPLLSYKLRVMLHHLRDRIDGPAAPDWAKGIIEVMRQQGPAMLQQQTRRSQKHLDGRANPFPFFRVEPEEEEGSPEEPDDETTDVAAYFDYAGLRGVLLRSDGARGKIKTKNKNGTCHTTVFIFVFLFVRRLVGACGQVHRRGRLCCLLLASFGPPSAGGSARLLHSQRGVRGKIKT